MKFRHKRRRSEKRDAFQQLSRRVALAADFGISFIDSTAVDQVEVGLGILTSINTDSFYQSAHRELTAEPAAEDKGLLGDVIFAEPAFEDDILFQPEDEFALETVEQNFLNGLREFLVVDGSQHHLIEEPTWTEPLYHTNENFEPLIEGSSFWISSHIQEFDDETNIAPEWSLPSIEPGLDFNATTDIVESSLESEIPITAQVTSETPDFIAETVFETSAITISMPNENQQFDLTPLPPSDSFSFEPQESDSEIVVAIRSDELQSLPIAAEVSANPDAIEAEFATEDIQLTTINKMDEEIDEINRDKATTPAENDNDQDVSHLDSVFLSSKEFFSPESDFGQPNATIDGELAQAFTADQVDGGAEMMTNRVHSLGETMLSARAAILAIEDGSNDEFDANGADDSTNSHGKGLETMHRSRTSSLVAANSDTKQTLVAGEPIDPLSMYREFNIFSAISSSEVSTGDDFDSEEQSNASTGVTFVVSTIAGISAWYIARTRSETYLSGRSKSDHTTKDEATATGQDATVRAIYRWPN